MAWGRGTAILSVTLLLATAATASVPVGTDSETEPDVDALEAAFTWSSQNEESLLSGWVLAAGVAGNTAEAVEAYEAGVAWAQEHSLVADRALLEGALEVYLSGYGSAPTDMARVPNAVVPGLAVLVLAQNEIANQPLPTGQHDAIERHAWLLGAVDVASTQLRTVPLDAWPSDPVLVDPLGLVIIGSSGDDVYDESSLAIHVTNPLLVLEPGGDDTYNIHIASLTYLSTPARTQFLTNPAIALELRGNDAYNKHAADAALIGTMALLVDEQGDDQYGKPVRYAVAVAAPGTSSLIDKQGNDTYRTRDFGIAYAQTFVLPPLLHATVVLDERSGDDTYTARSQQLDQGFTHAAAQNTGSIAILRDKTGNDTYNAHFAAHASSEDGAATIFLDEQGDDHYHVHLHSSTSYGSRYAEEHGLESIGNRGLAWFTDANGTDQYTNDSTCCNPRTIDNNHHRVHGHPDFRYSIYQDCTTPPQSHTPCPQNDEANRNYLTATN